MRPEGELGQVKCTRTLFHNAEVFWFWTAIYMAEEPPSALLSFVPLFTIAWLQRARSPSCRAGLPLPCVPSR
jgi:hypothetical protein